MPPLRQYFSPLQIKADQPIADPNETRIVVPQIFSLQMSDF
jgi:hypothetical protein